MPTPKVIFKAWRDGGISTGCALYQFFGDHAFGCSIPHKLKIVGFKALVFLADRLPWFARKRLINALIGQEVYYDFSQADHAIQRDRNEFELCIKW